MGKDVIKPDLASGFKDYLPDEMIPRQKMLDTIRAVFERFGYAPLDTPGLEKEEILTGGDPDFKMNIFKARINESEEDMALRFDLTVPLARVMAANPELKKPFRRYQIGKVWRGERPQAGRYREFTQCDADIVGSKSVLADAEIISMIYQSMRDLGIERFKIKINDRKILNGLYQYAGFNESDTNRVIRVIDKLDKQGWDNVTSEMKEMGLSVDSIEKIKSFIDIDDLDAAEKMFSDSDAARQGISELKEISGYLESMNVPRSSWDIDFSVARGLGYYTGPVFETYLNDLQAIGSVCSGGRYDGLMARFSSDSLPATGTSFGIDRLFAALSELNLISKQDTVAKAIVLNFEPKALAKCLSIVTKLRDSGIATEMYIGSENLTGQLTYAVKKGFEVAIIVGSNEVERGTVQIKNIQAKTQVEVADEDILKEVNKI